VVNMAIVGVFAGYLPYHLFARGRGRRAAIFAGSAISVLASACLALAELLISGVHMPGPMLPVSVGLFVISALLEGAITSTVLSPSEGIQPGFVRHPATGRSFAVTAVAGVAVVLAAGGVVFASTQPDGIEHLVGIHAGGTDYGRGAGLLGIALL